MVKGVQHPMRGLFLRYYLLKMMKDKLPDTQNDYEINKYDDNENIDDEASCNVKNSMNFIMANLSEMNKLWTRMQSNKSNTKREKERIDLKVLVGENITRIS